MDSSDGQVGALPGTGWSKEDLEEMLWLYRAEDSTPWNIAILVLSSLVFVLNAFLLGRNIMANRNQKMNSQYRQAVESRSSFDTVTNNKNSVSLKDDNTLNILKETLLSENQDPEQVMIEMKEGANIVLSPVSSGDGIE
ncbi:organic solute transporter subunit beta [Dromiciops gliroides]|uniref:organic solute transporter subunit beta n=1 Tax=Dromiciops gliroides TaxID=33562 RepID=UPI001CC4E3C1|nr:organic solute transporter subunit beta [Dromiciops gliroides]XP_043842836.1 organic solute transporter subunit beta [Dromiciops gliroides]